MTAQARLRWWLATWLSILLTAATVIWYGETIVEADRTFISFGIAAVYFLMTAWIGIAIHTSWDIPLKWVKYLVNTFPGVGLIGALLGMVELFGLNSGGADMANSAAILNGLGLVLFATLAGIVYSEFLALQLRACDLD